ncbi:hypothetical protein ABZ547_08405 [Streptomyces sparsogenes]|uniref:hypothetical protein n=1 Tax=Streptomyces sparsogenes TaxID=67365 RepID=UPI0033FCAE82
MNDVTPAALLRAAAEKVRGLAADADREVDTNPYWRSELTERPGWYANGVRNGLGGSSGELAAAMHPGVGAALAAWLEHTAGLVESVARQRPDAATPDAEWLAPALAVARQIAGSES